MRTPLPFTDQLSLLLGQWFWSGRAKYAPGTIGSLGAIPLFLIARMLDPISYWALTLLISVGGIFVSQRCAEILNDKDPSSVVIDEVAGVMIAMGCVSHSPLWVIALSWGIFRLLDIFKPWLIDRAQYLKPSGLGIMADDLLAGAVAGGLAWSIGRWV